MDERLDDLLEAEFDSVKFEKDVDGHTRVIFSPEELEEVNRYLSEELNRTYDDYQPIWNNAVENLETYKAIRMHIQDSGLAMYPAPLARIPADQVIASTYNSVVRPRPMVAIDAYLNSQYPVPQYGQMQGMPAEATIASAEDVAKRLRQGYEFLLRERINFPKKLLRAIGNAVKGVPSYWKVVANPDQKTRLTPKLAGAIVDFDDKYESTRQRGDIVEHYLVPFFNAMRPLDADDVSSAAWFAERTPSRPDQILKRWAAGDLFLIDDPKSGDELPAAVKALAQNTSDLYDPSRARIAATTEQKTPQAPTQVCDTWLTWFYWDAKYVSPIDGKQHIKRLNLLGDMHRPAGKLMNCFLNDYEHQERPYEIIDQFDDGGSTTENMRYHQTVFTHAMQAEIKTRFILNNPNYWHDPDNTEMVEFFQRNRKLGPGDHVPGKYGEDWGLEVGGGNPTFSMLELLKFILTMSQLDSKQSRYSSGDIPGRTPAYTMAQAIEQAGQEPHLFLHRLSDKMSRILRLDMETRRQFQPIGEVLPMWDAEAKRTVELPMQFPVGDVLDNFRIALTAADEALAKESDPQQIMANKQAIMTDGEFAAKVLAGILNIETPLPPSAVKFYAKIIARDQKQLLDLIGVSTTDEESYDLTPELQQVLMERAAQLQQAQQNPAPKQQPQQPHISISLSGKLTPEQETLAAQMLNLGGAASEVPNPNAQGNSAGNATGNAGGSNQPPAQQPVSANPRPPAAQGNVAGAGGLVQ